MPIDKLSALNSGRRASFDLLKEETFQPQVVQQESTQPLSQRTSDRKADKKYLILMVEGKLTQSQAIQNKIAMPAALAHLLNAGSSIGEAREQFSRKAHLQLQWSQQIKQAIAEKDSKAARTLLQHQFCLSYAEITGKSYGTAPERKYASTPESQQAATQKLEGIQARLSSAKDDDILSSWEIDDALTNAIGDMDDSYLSVYENILAKYNLFFKDFADFKSQLAKYVSPGDDGKIYVDSEGLNDALEKLLAKYSGSPPPSDAILFPALDEQGVPQAPASKEEAEKWAAEMGLPKECVQQLADGSWCCTVDLTPLQNIKQNLNDTFHIDLPWDLNEIDPAKYNAWLAGFDMQGDKYQNFMQVMTQKYTTANSVFDNLVKVLSSTITALLESDKTFFL